MKHQLDEIGKYIVAHSTPEDALLGELRRETNLKTTLPQMISTAVMGKLLTFLCQMAGATSVLEIGTFTGYSAICMARGLASGGRLQTIDINDELGEMVNRYIKKAELIDRIVVHHGNALNIIPTLEGSFDIVFIDADKVNYSNYYDLVFDKVRPGGFILADNVLWGGKVLKETKDKDTSAIHEFNQKVVRDDRVENILLGIADGLTIARKTER